MTANLLYNVQAPLCAFMLSTTLYSYCLDIFSAVTSDLCQVFFWWVLEVKEKDGGVTEGPSPTSYTCSTWFSICHRSVVALTYTSSVHAAHLCLLCEEQVGEVTPGLSSTFEANVLLLGSALRPNEENGGQRVCGSARQTMFPRASLSILRKMQMWTLIISTSSLTFTSLSKNMLLAWSKEMRMSAQPFWNGALSPDGRRDLDIQKRLG